MKTRWIACIFFTFCSTPASAEDWPQFRGPTGQGVSSETGLPLAWTAESGILFSTEVPGEGWSSPIVWGSRVFLTATGDGGASCRVLAFDTATGKRLWDREVFRQELRRKEKKNSHATPTPATDGERVYAVFGEGGIAAVSVEGEPVWTHREVKFHSKHGLGASPILHGDLLIMPFDGSNDGEDLELGWKRPWDRAFILALHRKTGKERWQGRRGLSRIAHMTPNVLSAGERPQLLSGAGDVVQGFDLETGERIWSVHSQGEGVVPSIVVGDGLVYSASGFEKPAIRAVRPGKRGGNGAGIAWEQTKGVPSIPSFIHRKPHLYAITDSGVATCFMAETGEVVWQGRVGGNHSASPVWADGRIYFLSEDGEMTVVSDGPRFEVLARSSLGERCQASPAISGGRIFIRSERRLHAIGKN